MNSKVVLFGPADYGKSTVVGYIYAKSAQMNMDKVERNLKDRLGNEYKSDYLYSSLINPEHASEKISRFSTRINNLKRIIDFTFIDTPGHDRYLDQREQGISLGQVGVFCLAINEVLNEKYEESMREFTDLWFEHYTNKKLICLLTKFDLQAYRQDDYEEVSERIAKCCRQVHIERRDSVFGVEIAFDVPEPGFAAIIPVAVEFDKRQSHNIISRSDKTSWYEGSILIDAIREQANELANV
jgi:elongation factor 1-alpha